MRGYLITGWGGGYTPSHVDSGVQVVMYHTIQVRPWVHCRDARTHARVCCARASLLPTMPHHTAPHHAARPSPLAPAAPAPAPFPAAAALEALSPRGSVQLRLGENLSLFGTLMRMFGDRFIVASNPKLLVYDASLTCLSFCDENNTVHLNDFW